MAKTLRGKILLAIDVGNTHTRFGLFAGAHLRASHQVETKDCRTPAGCRRALAELEHRWAARWADGPRRALLTALRRAEASGGKGLADSGIEICIASVVPEVNPILQKACIRKFGVRPAWVSHRGRTGVRLGQKNPAQVGADRIADALAACERYGAPCIVVDFGTATTLDVVVSDRKSFNRRGVYLGGVIAPGPVLGAQALFERTAKLPKVDLARLPRSTIGRDTEGAILSGLIYGYAGLVDGLVQRICKELKIECELSKFHGRIEGKKRELTVVATGGLARQMAGLCRTIQKVDPELTLRGIHLFWELNRSNRLKRA